MKAKVTITFQFAFWGCGGAIAKRSVGIAFWDVGAIAFGMWESDLFLGM
jgi:hypothetical protein